MNASRALLLRARVGTVCVCVCVCVCLRVVFCLLGAIVPLLLYTQEKRHCAVVEGYVLRGENAECSTTDVELAP